MRLETDELVSGRVLADEGARVHPRVRGAWLRGDRLTVLVDRVSPGTRHMLETVYGNEDDFAA